MKYYFILICLTLVFASPASAITLSTLRSDCRTFVKDAGASRNRFSDAALNRFINEGHKDLNHRTRVIRNSYEFELAVGATYYGMPGDFQHALRVTRDYLFLPERSIQNLDKNQEWQSVSGLPINYFVHFATRTSIGFYPFPDSSSSTGTIRVDYIATAGELSADGDQPFNGIQELQPHGYLISLYCAYRAGLIDGNQTAQFYRQEYFSGLKWLDEDGKARIRYRPGASGGGVGYR